MECPQDIVSNIDALTAQSDSILEFCNKVNKFSFTIMYLEYSFLMVQFVIDFVL